LEAILLLEKAYEVKTTPWFRSTYLCQSESDSLKEYFLIGCAWSKCMGQHGHIQSCCSCDTR